MCDLIWQSKYFRCFLNSCLCLRGWFRLRVRLRANTLSSTFARGGFTLPSRRGPSSLQMPRRGRGCQWVRPQYGRTIKGEREGERCMYIYIYILIIYVYIHIVLEMMLLAPDKSFCIMLSSIEPCSGFDIRFLAVVASTWPALEVPTSFNRALRSISVVAFQHQYNRSSWNPVMDRVWY